MKYYNYYIFGCYVASDLEINLAYPLKTDHPDILIEKKELSEQFKEEMREGIAKEAGCLYHHEKQWSCIYYPRQGFFQIEQGHHITYDLEESADYNQVVQILLCNCMSSILHQRGNLLIHGSASFYQGHAIIISGKSGAGKSTLTNELLLQGAELMSDDAACISKEKDTFMVNSGFPIQKLCTDVMEDKAYDKEGLIYIDDGIKHKYIRMSLENYHMKKEKVDAIYIIKPQQSLIPSIQELQKGEKLKALLDNYYNQSLIQSDGFPPELFLKLVNLCSQMRVFELIRPISGLTVADQLQLINETLRG